MKIKYAFNQILAIYQYHFAKIKVKNKPQVFAIELTNYCNLDCAMCPRQAMKRRVGFMDAVLFKKIISQIKDYNHAVWLHLFGESLFHPQIGEFIDYCAENGIKAKLSTNGTVLTKEKSSILLNSKLDTIILSIDAVTREKYQKIRVKGDFDATRENITNFLKLKKELKKTKPFTITQVIKMNETEDEISMFKKEWGNTSDAVIVKNFCTWASQIKEIKGMAKDGHLYHVPRNKRYPCLALWNYVVVMWNGDVVPCCRDYDGKMVLGNLNQESLEDVWNSEKMQKLRKEHIGHNYDNPLCKDCIEWYGYSQKHVRGLIAFIYKYIRRN